MDWENLRGILLLAFGFGFVVFWHELGHFLAAKWAGVKVEQFAVGFGQALLAWRKGLGLRLGTTTKEFNQRIDKYLESKGTPQGDQPVGEKADDASTPNEMERVRAAQALGLGETEYRLNWIPLGGYVKMLGQDDLKPNTDADDPRAYNRQSIAKRMVIVSAGVVMNVILAAIGFMVLFQHGFHVPPAEVGNVSPGSPAQQAGMHVGDKIYSIDGKRQYDDWTKVQLNSALAEPDVPIPVVVERGPEGARRRETLTVTPRRAGGPSRDFVGMGIAPAIELKGPEPKDKDTQAVFGDEKQLTQQVGTDIQAIRPGETIVAVKGQPVQPDDYPVLDAAVQASAGAPVAITVKRLDSSTEERWVRPHLSAPFGDEPLNFAGMIPRVRLAAIGASTPSYGYLLPGDVVAAVGAGRPIQERPDPSFRVFKETISAAGSSGGRVTVTVLRDGKEYVVSDLPTIRINAEERGLGVQVGFDEDHAVVADAVAGSPADAARVPQGATITAVGGQPVKSWNDALAQMRLWVAAHKPGSPAAAPLPIAYVTRGGESGQASLDLNEAIASAVESARYEYHLALRQPSAMRKAGSAMEAMSWGVTETRDFILQFYLTLRRMVTGGVSAKNVMGPLGIFQAGSGFASRGNDWLLWFLSMISANLAVVNFLPIPIVDGGLFTFLILEKLKGKPLSPKTQAVAQYIGLALLLGVFLFVTYQDIANFQFRR